MLQHGLFDRIIRSLFALQMAIHCFYILDRTIFVIFKAPEKLMTAWMTLLDVLISQITSIYILAYFCTYET